jgi:hypothetical protein
VQFGFDHTKGEIPVKLLQEGGVDIVRIRPADGRGLPFMLNGILRFVGNSRMSSSGSFDPDYAAALKSAGVSWMATDIVAVNADIYPELVTLI